MYFIRVKIKHLSLGGTQHQLQLFEEQTFEVIFVQNNESVLSLSPTPVSLGV